MIGVELALWYSMVFHLPLSSSPRIFFKFGFSVFHQSYQWVVIGCSHHYLGMNPKKWKSLWIICIQCFPSTLFSHWLSNLVVIGRYEKPIKSLYIKAFFSWIFSMVVFHLIVTRRFGNDPRIIIIIIIAYSWLIHLFNGCLHLVVMTC